jgi:polyhydroxyalkanoate synthesis regulator phasin
MNYYKKENSYIASDLDLSLQKATEKEYLAWKEKQDTISELKKELLCIDEKSARSMRAVLAETAAAEDREFLASLEAQATELRRQIRELESA